MQCTAQTIDQLSLRSHVLLLLHLSWIHDCDFLVVLLREADVPLAGLAGASEAAALGAAAAAGLASPLADALGGAAVLADVLGCAEVEEDVEGGVAALDFGLKPFEAF